MRRRRLTAVLAADVVGYSRLMREDANGTLATLRRLRTEIFGTAIAAKRGKIVKSMGDGWIVTFGAVADAVECAMQIQDQLKIDGTMQLRMGVHLGDVAEADEDVFGDGINVAARLQEIADPGALAISGAARALMDGTLRPSFDKVGERVLKNIAEPVAVWVRGGDVAGIGASLKGDGFPRLAILPIETTDDRAEVRELAAALTGDLGSYLGSLRFLDARIAEQPKRSDYFLHGRLRTSGDRLRVEIELLDEGGAAVDSAKRDGSLDNAFDWQDVATAELASEVINAVIGHQAAKAEASDVSRTAEQSIMMGLFVGGQSAEQFRAMIGHAERAISLDLDMGYAYAQALSYTVAGIAVHGEAQFADFAPKIKDWKAAIERLEPPSSPAHIMLAFSSFAQDGNHKAAKARTMALLRRLPFDPEALFWAGWLHLFMGEACEGLAHLESLARGQQIHALKPATLGGIGFANIQLNRFEAGVEYADKALGICPDYMSAYRFKASALAQLRRTDEARETIAQLPDGETISALLARTRYSDKPGIRTYLDGLRKAGLPE